MIQGRNIICISNTTWFGPFTKSTVQLMSRLAVGNKMLFVEYPYTIKDLIMSIFKKGSAPVEEILGWKNRLSIIETSAGSKVYKLVMPPVFPCDFIRNNSLFNFVFGINTLIYKTILRQTLKKISFSSPVVISAYNPFYGKALKGHLNESLTIYYAYDGPNLRRHGKRVLSVDADYSKMVDAVITTSDYLADEKRRHNPSCFVVKNGVDIGMFKPFAKKYAPSEESSIIGYIGNLDMRFDVKLMEEVVKLLPQYQFHFTGSVRNAQVFDTLSVYPNVRFFKPVKPDEVPALLAGCSVGVIPYTCNEINKNIYPLKINEYLAVGVPVVMTPFAQLPEFSEMVDVAGDALSFAKCIVNQIETDSAEKTEKRKTFAAANSWEKRASEFSDIIHILTTPVK